MLAKKPNMALKSIIRAAAGNSNTNTLPTDLSIIKDEAWGLLITNPLEVANKIAELETIALSPDPPSLHERRFPGSATSGQHPHRMSR